MPTLPRPVVDERDGLLTFLEQQRLALRLSAYGLTDAQARSTPSASKLSVGGLIKHAGRAERTWMNTLQQLPRSGDPDAYARSFVMDDDDSLPEILVDYAAAVNQTNEIVAGFPDLAAPVPVPQGLPFLPDDVEYWSVRWILLHLIQETARHAGHADIVRESIDGASAMSLMAAAEGWPDSDWLHPWKPADD